MKADTLASVIVYRRTVAPVGFAEFWIRERGASPRSSTTTSANAFLYCSLRAR